jgi:hypothetical protein
MSGDAPSPAQEHLTPADVLNAAADLIEPEGRWTRGVEARDAEGKELMWGTDPMATCWCMVGALEATSRRGPNADMATQALFRSAIGILCEVVGESVPDFNDAPECAQSDAVAALRKAAALAAADVSARKDGSSPQQSTGETA